MVSARIGVARQTAQSTNGATRTFSPWSGFGRVRGGIAVGTNAQSLNTVTVQNKLSIGFFDEDLVNVSQCIKSRTSRTTTSANRRASDDRCFEHMNNAGSAVVGDGRVSAHAIDGVTVTYDDGYPVSAQHYLFCFGGDDVVTKAGYQLMDQALNGTEDIAVNFVPTGIIAAGSKSVPTATGTGIDARMFLGMAADHDGSVVQGGWNWTDENGVGVGTKEVYGLPTNTYLIAPILANGGSCVTDGAFKVTAFGDNGDGTGYVRIQKLVDDVDHWITFLVIGGVPMRVKHNPAPTSIGTQAVTGLGIAPRGAIQISCRSAATIESITGPGNGAASIGIGAYGPSSAPTQSEGSVCVASQATASPTLCQSYAANDGMKTGNHTMASFMTATINDGTGSWDSDGSTKHYTSVLSANHVWELYIEEDTPSVDARDVARRAAQGTAGASADAEASALSSRMGSAAGAASAGAEAFEVSSRIGVVAASSEAALSAVGRRSDYTQVDAGADAATQAIESRRLLASAVVASSVGVIAQAVSRRAAMAQVAISADVIARGLRQALGQAAVSRDQSVEAIETTLRTGLVAITLTTGAVGGPGETMTIVFDMRTEAVADLELIDSADVVFDMRASGVAELDIVDSATVVFDIRTDAGAELD